MIKKQYAAERSQIMEQKVFKSSLLILIKHILYALGAGFVVGLILYWFFQTNYPYVPYVGAGLVTLLSLYFVLVRDNIRIVLTDEDLWIYRMGKKKYAYRRDECTFASKIIRTTDSTMIPDSDCTLIVTDARGKTKSIDCSMLGFRRFHRFVDAMGLLKAQETELETTLKTTKKK